MSPHHIYLADTRQITDDGMFEELLSRVPLQRREKVRRFAFRKDRCLSLCAGLLLQYGMWEAGLPANTNIVWGKQGKPRFEDVPGVHFNLSHAGYTAVCVFSDRPVGVDVETVRPFDEKLADFVFLPDEIEWVKGQGDSRTKDAAFTRLWTVKESVMKYYGMGLSLSPRKIHLDRGQHILFAEGLPDAPKLQITPFETDGGLISVCSGQPFSAQPRLIHAEVLLSTLKKR